MPDLQPPKTVEFIFDFASPNAYLAWRVLPKRLESAGATIEIVPALLGGVFKATGNRAPMEAFAAVPAKLAYERLEMQRFIQRHGLSRFRMNPHFPVSSLLLMRGLIAAQAMTGIEAYVEAGLKAMWEDGEKMDDPEVFRRVLDAAGLDGGLILQRTQDPEVKGALIADTQKAVERGVFGIPTFFVGEEMFFGKDRLDQVAEAVST